MEMKRRTFLHTSLAGSALAVGASFFPQAVLAEWPKAAFDAKAPSEILQALFGAGEMTDSADIEVKAPDIAENGAVVPIQITTSIANIQSITLVVEKNPVPLIASFKFPDPALAEGSISTRIKMATSSDVIAVVQADGKLYAARKEVKVTVGGCGG